MVWELWGAKQTISHDLCMKKGVPSEKTRAQPTTNPPLFSRGHSFVQFQPWSLHLFLPTEFLVGFGTCWVPCWARAGLSYHRARKSLTLITRMTFTGSKTVCMSHPQDMGNTALPVPPFRWPQISPWTNPFPDKPNLICAMLKTWYTYCVGHYNCPFMVAWSCLDRFISSNFLIALLAGHSQLMVKSPKKQACRIILPYMEVFEVMEVPPNHPVIRPWLSIETYIWTIIN